MVSLEWAQIAVDGVNWGALTFLLTFLLVAGKFVFDARNAVTRDFMAGKFDELRKELPLNFLTRLEWEEYRRKNGGAT